MSLATAREGRAYSPATGRPSVQIFHGTDGLHSLEGEWRELERRGAAATPFQSFVVASACARVHERKGEEVRIAVVRRGSEATLLFPAIVTRWLGLPILRFLGDPLVQYGDVVGALGVDPEDLSLAWSAVADPKIACLALLRRVREDALIANVLSLNSRISNVQESPLIDLTRTSKQNSHYIREIRRQRRKLGTRGDLQTEFLTGPNARPWLHEALRLKREWLKRNALASAVIGDPDWEGALDLICDCQGRLGSMIVAALLLDAQPIAVDIAFVDGRCWYGFIGAFDPAFASMGPGQVLSAACIEHARTLGLAIFDQLPPWQPYKARQATRAIGLRDYSIALTGVGRLISFALGSLPELKNAVQALPADVRRPLMALVQH